MSLSLSFLNIFVYHVFLQIICLVFPCLLFLLELFVSGCCFFYNGINLHEIIFNMIGVISNERQPKDVL